MDNYSFLNTVQTSSENDAKVLKEYGVMRLIEQYRTYGHLAAKTNPLKDRDDVKAPDFSIEKFGLSQDDLNTKFEAAKAIQLSDATLSEIIEQLKNVYCSSIGIEYKYMMNTTEKEWIQSKIEAPVVPFDAEQKKYILDKIIEAVGFETFLNSKYVGQKRFSLEGAESAVPALDMLVEVAAAKGVKEFVLGMAHRGRLNVLANVFKKDVADIISEFDGKDYDEAEGFDGDVKYHLGISTSRVTKSGNKINMNMAPNPSHLEPVYGVIEGIARAKQDREHSSDISKVLPVVLHGDASVSGQGVVYEVLQMSGLRGFKTGGTIHLIINNQLGFSTNNTDSRSSLYCSDIAKTTDGPILHVNADDAEASVRAMLFALEYRMEFGKDVFIDLMGYRKYGHNEGDEPRFTQPILYKIISKHPNPRIIYSEALIKENVIDNDYVNFYEKNYKEGLEGRFNESRTREFTVIKPFMEDDWKGFKKADAKRMLETFETKVSKEVLNDIAETITNLPDDKNFLRKLVKLINDRKNNFEGDKLDWALGEMMVYGSLLKEGYDIRITGEDVERGTFSHRHAVTKTEDTEEPITLLNNLKDKKGNFYIYNSLLSEYGVSAYEYGYALCSPKTLNIWEAQFGDFSNGSQITIDQYFSAGESKWNSQNGLVFLLPHGYEHQGSEHSSARMERYLQLCAEDNMFVADCTTPANFFHLLRRQMVTDFRKPLVVFTPKSLLRNPLAVSPLKDFTDGSFQQVIGDDSVNPADVKSLVFCTGKVYYDLLAKREELGRNDVALVRVEQLFPLPIERLKEEIAKYPNVDDYVWAQEEPKNMGAYGYMLMNFQEVKLRLAAGKAFAAPASGSSTRSKKRQALVIAKVFDKNL